MHAMNILSVSEAGNRQPAGCLAGSTRPAGVKPVRWGLGRWGCQWNKRATTSSPSSSFPIPSAFPSPSEQSPPTGTGSDVERRLIKPGQFLWPGQTRKEKVGRTGVEMRRDRKHSASSGSILFGCVCITFLFIEYSSSVSPCWLWCSVVT